MEFLNREDGLLGITKKYNFEFKDTKGLDGSPRYTALINKETSVVDAFSTDGLLKKFDLVSLEDDKNFFLHIMQFLWYERKYYRSILK